MAAKVETTWTHNHHPPTLTDLRCTFVRSTPAYCKATHRTNSVTDHVHLNLENTRNPTGSEASWNAPNQHTWSHRPTMAASQPCLPPLPAPQTSLCCAIADLWSISAVPFDDPFSADMALFAEEFVDDTEMPALPSSFAGAFLSPILFEQSG